jgi:hypothetical protein
MRNFLIDVKYGGLGDHLFYSPVPRLLKLKYGSSCRVYLSSEAVFRNSETYELVWANNPHLDGIKGPSDLNFEELAKKVSTDGLHVSQIILANYSLDYSEEIDPEIYYEVPSRPGFPKKLIDLNYSSYTGLLDSDILRIVEEVKGDYYFINPSSKIRGAIPDINAVQTSSLFEYASLLKNSACFFCLTSGGAVLARALGKVANVYIEPNYPKTFMYARNNHIKIADSSPYRRLVSSYLWERNLRRRVYDK